MTNMSISYRQPSDLPERLSPYGTAVRYVACASIAGTGNDRFLDGTHGSRNQRPQRRCFPQATVHTAM